MEKKYKDFVKEFGIKIGAIKWNDYKMGLEPVKEELTPLKDVIIRGPEYTIPNHIKGTGRGIVLKRGRAMVDLIQSEAWTHWLKPQIEADISNNIRVTFNQPDRREEAIGKVNYGKRILTLVKKWLDEFKLEMSREDK